MTSVPAQTMEQGLDRHYDTSARTQNPTMNAAATSKAQDLAIFGLIGLGIVGLLWIRRHTSEL